MALKTRTTISLVGIRHVSRDRNGESFVPTDRMISKCNGLSRVKRSGRPACYQITIIWRPRDGLEVAFRSTAAGHIARRVAMAGRGPRERRMFAARSFFDETRRTCRITTREEHDGSQRDYDEAFRLLANDAKPLRCAVAAKRGADPRSGRYPLSGERRREPRPDQSVAATLRPRTSNRPDDLPPSAS